MSQEACRLGPDVATRRAVASPCTISLSRRFSLFKRLPLSIADARGLQQSRHVVSDLRLAPDPKEVGCDGRGGGEGDSSCARTDISMPVCNGDIRAYIGFLVVNVKARGGTTSQGMGRGAVIQCLTLRRQVVTTARRRRSRSRVNRTRNDACSHARKQRRIATPPDCTCTKAIDNVAAGRITTSSRACRRVSLLTRMSQQRCG